MQPNCIFIAMTTADLGLEVMQFISRGAVAKFRPGEAFVENDKGEKLVLTKEDINAGFAKGLTTDFVDDADIVWRVFDTSDEAIAREISRRPPGSKDIVRWRRIEEAEYRAMGSDRDFRTAWSDDGERLHVPLDKARDCLRNRLRLERKPLLEELDISALDALQVGDKSALEEISAEKQRLRDITKNPAIDAAKALADLRKITLAA